MTNHDVKMHLYRIIQVIFILDLFHVAFGAPTTLSATTGPSFLELPIALSNRSSTRKRAIDVSLTNIVRSYEVQLGIGTPAQPVTLTLDTGSSDIWTYGPGSCLICEGGIYNPKQSTSGTYANDVGLFGIEYFDQTVAYGYFVRDNIQLAGTTVSSAVIAVTTDTSDKFYGLMGIGLKGLETVPTKYNGFLDDLKSQGLISTRGYSLHLSDLQSSTGSILLGALDTSKYTGNLVTFPIVLSSDGLSRLNILWNGISITNSQGATKSYYPSSNELTLPYPAVLDTGYTLTVLPDDIFLEFAAFFGAALNVHGHWKVDCNLGAGYVNFGFGGSSGGTTVISVPFSELAVRSDAIFSPAQDATGGCVFGFIPMDSSAGPVISFGDTFLRSAYAVYDFDDMTISLAQAA